MSWEALDIDTKGMAIQRGFENYDDEKPCKEIRECFDLLASRDSFRLQYPLTMA